jgi:muconolactone delta-isomerase
LCWRGVSTYREEHMFDTEDIHELRRRMAEGEIPAEQWEMTS